MLQDTVPEEIVEFRRARFAAVTGPMGDAALVATIWVDGPTATEAFPGTWDLDPADPETLRFTPPQDGCVSSGGAPVARPLVVAPVAAGGPVLDLGTSLRAIVLRWPGLGLAVRVWDRSRAASLVAITSYPHDAAWRIEGRFSPRERTIGYGYRGHGGRTEERHVAGEIAIAIGGRDYALLVTRNAAGLTTVFGDATNGKETYGGGRFVSVLEQGDGRAVVDFNLSTLPPCAFSPHFDCPLPPPQNVIGGRVPAGEKRLEWGGPASSVGLDHASSQRRSGTREGL